LEVYAENPSAKDFAESLMRQARLPLNIVRPHLPKEVKEQSHQGLAFRTDFDFRISEGALNSENFPRILFANHIEDVQNFGAIIRSAAAFGFTLIAHENKRSAALNAAAVKTSAGLAFRVKFLEVANLSYLARSLIKDGYQVAALENREEAVELYDWQPLSPLVVVMGSESDGVSKPLLELADPCVRIPLVEGVDSLNVAQAASVALSWAHCQLEK